MVNSPSESVVTMTSPVSVETEPSVLVVTKVVGNSVHSGHTGPTSVV